MAFMFRHYVVPLQAMVSTRVFLDRPSSISAIYTHTCVYIIYHYNFYLFYPLNHTYQLQICTHTEWNQKDNNPVMCTFEFLSFSIHSKREIRNWSKEKRADSKVFVYAPIQIRRNTSHGLWIRVFNIWRYSPRSEENPTLLSALGILAIPRPRYDAPPLLPSHSLPTPVWTIPEKLFPKAKSVRNLPLLISILIVYCKDFPPFHNMRKKILHKILLFSTLL